jgi:hypothetical protein
MTADQRAAAVERLGYTPRQSQFLAIVALHSGYCLRRQYEAFAGIRYGKSVRDFLDGLVTRRLAERFTGRADRGHVYHLRARLLYRALGDENNRNRRRGSAAQIARKLMLLDYVLSRPDVQWFATEAEKVDLFVQRFGVPQEELPRRMVRPSAADETTAHARFFLHKLPIYLSGESPVAHFVYLATEAGGEGLVGFLRDHGCGCMRKDDSPSIPLPPDSIHASWQSRALPTRLDRRVDAEGAGRRGRVAAADS